MKFRLDVFLYLFLLSPQYVFALQSSATLTLVGFIRPVTTITTVDYRRDLTIDATSSHRFQKIGQVAVQMNTDVEGIYVQSSTPTDFAEPIVIQVNESCKSLQTSSVAESLGQNVPETQMGIQETCEILANWKSRPPHVEGQNNFKHKVYPVQVVVTLVSL